MADDLRRKAPEDPNFINMHEKWEVEYWCKALNCTEARLRAAVAAVGNSVAKVREYLARR